VIATSVASGFAIDATYWLTQGEWVKFALMAASAVYWTWIAQEMWEER
jgi:hypothetical protein